MAWSGSPMTQRFAPPDGQQPQQAILGQVDVLVLVHRNPAIARLHGRQHVRVRLEQAHGLQDQVVEVHGLALGAAPLRSDLVTASERPSVGQIAVGMPAVADGAS